MATAWAEVYAPPAGLNMGAATVPAITVKFITLLTAPPTVTTTLPVVAPAGTAAVMLVALQLVGAAGVPLNVIVLMPCPKPVPVMVIDVPTVPEVGLRLVMLGVTLKLNALLANAPTVTTTFPVVAPAGTVVVMVVSLQVVGVDAVPLKVMVLVPCVAPKLVPVIVIDVPIVPEV
jgi:hypothetical protein